MGFAVSGFAVPEGDRHHQTASSKQTPILIGTSRLNRQPRPLFETGSAFRLAGFNAAFLTRLAITHRLDSTVVPIAMGSCFRN
jgi:hypothetical protein